MHTHVHIRLTLNESFYLCELLSHVWLFVTPWTVAHQAPLSMGILQARILEWVAIPFSRGPSQSRDQIQVSCIAGRFFIVRATREAPMRVYPDKKLFLKNINIIYLFSYAGSELWHLGSLLRHANSQLWHVGSIPWPGIELALLALGVQSPSHCTTREVPKNNFEMCAKVYP